MVQRRNVVDDSRGVGENMNETMCGCRDCACTGLIVRGSMNLVVGPTSLPPSPPTQPTSPTRRLQAAARLAGRVGGQGRVTPPSLTPTLEAQSEGARGAGAGTSSSSSRGSSRVLAPSVIRRQQQLLNDPPVMALMELGPSWPGLQLGAAAAAAAGAAAAGTRGRLEGLRLCFSALGMDHCPPTAAEGGQAKEVLPQEQRQQQPHKEQMQAARASRQADMEPDPDQPAQKRKLALPGVEPATSSILPNRRLGQGSAGGGGQVGGEGEGLGGEAYQLPPSAALLTWQLLAPDSVLVRLAHLFQVSCGGVRI
ncbi:hypothetical protein V8C86DRAFT_892041 [Haematococcus lacustris]